MPYLISMIATMLLNIAATLVGRVLLALGFVFIEYTGIQILVDSVKTKVMALMQISSSDSTAIMLQWMGFFQIDVIVSIILSAAGVKLLFNGISGGSIKKLARK